MTTSGKNALDQLIALWNQPNPWGYDLAELAPLQIAAAQHRFDERRSQIKVLDSLATDNGVDRINTLQDFVPLLLSHTSYKSYPASFLTKGRWQLMTQWLGTLSTQPTTNVNVDGIRDIDDWIARLHDAGHFVISSSGTSGTSSFVNQTADDREFHRMTIAKSGEVTCGLKSEKRFLYFNASPRFGRNMAAENSKLVAQTYAKEEFHLSDEYVAVAELDRLAMLRKAVIDGTATADQIAAAEGESSQQAQETEKKIQRFLDNLFERRHEPIYLFAGANMVWRIVEAGRSRGIKDGEFNPELLLRTGGGMKGFRGPVDYLDDALKFFGIGKERVSHGYGMTELLAPHPKCSAGAFHVPPTTLLILLDKAGQKVLNQTQGVVEGRGAFFDLTLTGRWGGVISGDRLTVNFDRCACGWHSPGIVEIARYKDLPEGDDKLSCAGQVDTYIRGFAGGDWQE